MSTDKDFDKLMRKLKNHFEPEPKISVSDMLKELGLNKRKVTK